MRPRESFEGSRGPLPTLFNPRFCPTIGVHLTPTTADLNFEFCGYDILDSFNSVSVLTNCGAFPGIFKASEVNQYGLLDDLSRSLEIAAQLREAEPDDPHCEDCHVWSLCRYVGPA